MSLTWFKHHLKCVLLLSVSPETPARSLRPCESSSVCCVWRMPFLHPELNHSHVKKGYCWRVVGCRKGQVDLTVQRWVLTQTITQGRQCRHTTILAVPLEGGISISSNKLLPRRKNSVWFLARVSIIRTGFRSFSLICTVSHISMPGWDLQFEVTWLNNEELAFISKTGQ